MTNGTAPATSTGTSGLPSTKGTGRSANPAQEAAVDQIVQNAIKERHLRSVIVRVLVDGKEIITRAYGESMTGVPATTDMHFRNGAVAISYVSTLLLILVDEKKVNLDDKVSTWLPDIPHSDEVTLGQLAQMTSGYTDYVIGNEEVDTQLYADPFRQWTTEEILASVMSKPLLYAPGTNWNYAHTNYVILGLALEKITGKKMQDVLQEKVLGPLATRAATPPVLKIRSRSSRAVSATSLLSSISSAPASNDRFKRSAASYASSSSMAQRSARAADWVTRRSSTSPGSTVVSPRPQLQTSARTAAFEATCGLAPP
jgi:CubicO group peptidase (beta-lactamase class C family)